MLSGRHNGRHGRRTHIARLHDRRTRHDHRTLGSEGTHGFGQALHENLEADHRPAEHRDPHQESQGPEPECKGPGRETHPRSGGPGRGDLHLGHHLEAQGSHALPCRPLRPGGYGLRDFPHRRQRRLSLGAAPVAHLRVLDRTDLRPLEGCQGGLSGPAAHGRGPDARPQAGAPHRDADRAAGDREDLQACAAISTASPVAS